MRLYTVVEAVPSRILGIAQLLQSTPHRDLTREEVINLLQPPNMRKGADGEAHMAPDVIGAALELGIIEEFENPRLDKCLRLSKHATIPQSHDSPREHWARWIVRRIMHDLIDGVSLDMATIFTWLMTIPVNDTPEDEAGWKKRFGSDGFDIDTFGVKNDPRWHNIFYWTHFLGLTWQISSDKAAGIVCDPSVLIRRFLDEIIAPGETIPADVFRDRLGKSLPILDGGLLHQEVRERVLTARGESREQMDRISPGVSMAIRELRERGQLDYYCPDDQRTFLLLDDGEKFAFASRSARRAQ